MNVFTRARLAALAAGLVVLSAQPARAAGNDYWAVDAFAVQDDDRIGESKLGFGGRLARGFAVGEHTAFELGLFGNPIKVKDGTGPGGHQTGLMGDLVLAFGDGSVKPYILAGLGGVRERWASDVTNTNLAIEAGAGLRFALASGTNLRLGATAQEVFNSDISSAKDAYVDYRFNLGVLWPFGAAPVAAAPAPVVAPADSDGDGVIDTRDACPTTPAATANGCPAPTPVAPPKDSDGDGVTDNLDQCPGTLKGLTVDARGCVISGGTQSVVLKGVNFKTGSAELTTEAKAVLDSAYASLAGQAGLKVEVGGYTDSLGDAAKNTALSAARANAVRAYLVSKGIPADRLTAKGYGSAQPIADNKTKEGRAQNRRVELKVVK